MPALARAILRDYLTSERAGLRRTKNLRVLQEQLRHVDIQTTTGYTRLTQQDRGYRSCLDQIGLNSRAYNHRNRRCSPSRSI